MGSGPTGFPARRIHTAPGFTGAMSPITDSRDQIPILTVRIAGCRFFRDYFHLDFSNLGELAWDDLCVQNLSSSRFHPCGAIEMSAAESEVSLRQEGLGLANEVRHWVNEVQARRPNGRSSYSFYRFPSAEPNPRTPQTGQRIHTVRSLPDPAYRLEPTTHLLDPQRGEQAHPLPHNAPEDPDHRVGTISSPKGAVPDYLVRPSASVGHRYDLPSLQSRDLKFTHGKYQSWGSTRPYALNRFDLIGRTAGNPFSPPCLTLQPKFSLGSVTFSVLQASSPDSAPLENLSHPTRIHCASGLRGR